MVSSVNDNENNNNNDSDRNDNYNDNDIDNGNDSNDNDNGNGKDNDNNSDNSYGNCDGNCNRNDNDSNCCNIIAKKSNMFYFSQSLIYNYLSRNDFVVLQLHMLRYRYETTCMKSRLSLETLPFPSQNLY